MQQLAGKTAIVTGAASGIGLGMARAFAREGMSVALCDIRGDRLDAALARGACARRESDRGRHRCVGPRLGARGGDAA